MKNNDEVKPSPCSTCPDEDHCRIKCPAFVAWFEAEWRTIRKYFGKDKKDDGKSV